MVSPVKQPSCTVIQSITPSVGLKSKNPTLTITKHPVEKKLTLDFVTTTKNPEDPKTYTRLKLDGSKQRITVKQGVETKNKAPLDNVDKMKEAIASTKKVTFKIPPLHLRTKSSFDGSA